MNKLAQEMETELTAHILPFWMEKAVDRENGGFYGYISSSLEVDAAHDKSGVLCARILWSFSRAYRMFGRREYLTAARRAYDYLRSYFWDAENGGIYWSVHYDGAPRDRKSVV